MSLSPAVLVNHLEFSLCVDMSLSASLQPQMFSLRVWVLADDRPGNTTQSVGLAQALGWSYEIKTVHFTPASRLRQRLFGMWGTSALGLDRTRSAPLVPPWPDIVIATGWRPAFIARWIRRQNEGKTFLIQLGRKGGHVANLFDVVLTCSYCHLPSHPNRIEIAAPITRVTAERLAEERTQWRHLFAGAPRPYVMLTVGGTTSRHVWDATVAQRLAEEVQASAATIGGTVFAITSRRTGEVATKAMHVGLGPLGHVHQWQPYQPDNPYLAYLAQADVLVVTGESESMLAEAAATGKPFYIYPLVERAPRLKARVKDWIASQAFPAAPSNLSPWRRVLQVSGRFLIASGLVRPRRDLQALHRALVDRGVARMFAGSLELWQTPPLQEVDEVAANIKARIQTWISMRDYGRRTAHVELPTHDSRVV